MLAFEYATFCINKKTGEEPLKENFYKKDKIYQGSSQKLESLIRYFDLIKSLQTFHMRAKTLPGGELNPGLPRDRRGYSPLYYRGDALDRCYNKYLSSNTNCQQKSMLALKTYPLEIGNSISSKFSNRILFSEDRKTACGDSSITGVDFSGVSPCDTLAVLVSISAGL